MKRSFFLILAATALCLLPFRPALCWNVTGHMVVASLAYSALTPKTKAAVDALLQHHRDYPRWVSQMPAGDTDRAQYAFLRAAAWPDDVRKTADDRPLWHFVDLPVIVPGFAADPVQTEPVKPNLLTQLPSEEALLSDKKTSDADRAAALCWVEHLIGDVHQPLHDASLFSAQFPKGDRGGNSDLLTPAAVASDPVEKAAHPHNLHALWDDMVGNNRDPKDVQKTAARLETAAFKRGTYPQIALHPTPDAWAKEGQALARDVAYQGGKLPLTPDGAKADAALPPGYLDAAHKIADRQLTLAGLRLADFLNSVSFPSTSSPVVTTLVPRTAPPALPVPGSALSGPIVGNRNSMAYHVGDDGHLPAPRNRVYFPTEAAAQKAGYHKVGP